MTPLELQLAEWQRQARTALDRPTMPPLRGTDEWCGARGAANRLLNVVKAVRGAL
jgi:hypothetical protein